MSLVSSTLQNTDEEVEEEEGRQGISNRAVRIARCKWKRPVNTARGTDLPLPAAHYDAVYLLAA